MITLVYPQGVHKQRCLNQYGREYWQYDGEMKRERCLLPFGGEIDIWLFDYQNVADEDVRLHMIDEIAGKRGISKAAALEWLKRVPQGVPCTHVKLVTRMPE